MTIELRTDGYPFTLHAEDMCKLLNIGRQTLYVRIKAGDVPRFTRTGRRYEWRRPDVEQWLAHPPRQLRRAQ